jgi:hypothetical protein
VAGKRLLESRGERLDQGVCVGTVDTHLGGREIECRAGIIARIGKLLTHTS